MSITRDASESLVTGFGKGFVMWRAFFLAIAIMLIIMGVESLFIGKVVMAEPKAITTTDSAWNEPLLADPTMVDREVEPPEWAPFSLLSAGAVLWLYSVSLRRGGGEE